MGAPVQHVFIVIKAVWNTAVIGFFATKDRFYRWLCPIYLTTIQYFSSFRETEGKAGCFCVAYVQN